MVISLGLVFLLASCASVTKDIKVDAQATAGAQWSDYQTYAWLGSAQIVVDTIGNWEPPSFDTDAVVRAFIDDELQSRELQEVSENPDLFVAFAAGVDMDAMELKVDAKTKKQMFASIPRGALAIVLIDAKTNKPVWVGAATGNISESPKDDVARQRLEYAVTEMFGLLKKRREATEDGY